MNSVQSEMVEQPLPNTLVHGHLDLDPHIFEHTHVLGLKYPVFVTYCRARNPTSTLHVVYAPSWYKPNYPVEGIIHLQVEPTTA